MSHISEPLAFLNTKTQHVKLNCDISYQICFLKSTNFYSVIESKESNASRLEFCTFFLLHKKEQNLREFTKPILTQNTAFREWQE